MSSVVFIPQSYRNLYDRAKPHSRLAGALVTTGTMRGIAGGYWRQEHPCSVLPSQ